MLNALQRPQHREWLLEQAEALLEFARKARQPLGFAYLDKNGEPDFGQPIQAWISCRMTHIVECLKNLHKYHDLSTSYP